MDKKYDKKPAREQASDITEGKEEPHFIGKKSNAVLQQEFFSAINTKDAFRNEKWKKNYEHIVNQIKDSPDGEAVLQSFKAKYQRLGRIPA